MTLEELINLINDDEIPLVEDEKGNISCIPNSVFRITLRFMAEDETAETVNLSSPLLIPWYDCIVYSIGPDQKNEYALEAWMRWEPHIKKRWPNRISRPFKKDQINHDFDKCIDDMIKGMKGAD